MDLDDAYLAAVNSGDMETAQRMVAEAAMQAGYTIEGWHGTNRSFSRFDKRALGSGNGQSDWGHGFYFGAEKGIAERFGSNIIRVALKMGNPLKIDALSRDYNLTMGEEFGFQEGTWKRWVRSLTPEQFQVALKAKGYDGVAVYAGTKLVEAVAFEPDQIISVAHVARDANGDVTPLSKRFQAAPNVTRVTEMAGTQIGASLAPSEIGGSDKTPRPVDNGGRTVLAVDEHGKNIVWREGAFFIAVDDAQSATYVTLWRDGVRGKVGFLRLTPGREHSTREYAVVADVEILPKYRGKGLGHRLYETALVFADPKFKGIASENPDRANKRQVPKIWKRLGANQRNEGTFLINRPTASKTPASKDEIYLAAVAAGDMETARKMVAAEAKAAGFKIGPVYHGTNAEFTEFAKGENRMMMRAEMGFWFSTEEADCKRFGKKVMVAYLSIKKPKCTTERKLDFEAVSRPASVIRAELAAQGVDGLRITPIKEDRTLDQKAQPEQWVAFSASQIRSAEAVCRDDDANVVPLSKRFLPGNDIRGAIDSSLSGRALLNSKKSQQKHTSLAPAR